MFKTIKDFDTVPFIEESATERQSSRTKYYVHAATDWRERADQPVIAVRTGTRVTTRPRCAKNHHGHRYQIHSLSHLEQISPTMYRTTQPCVSTREL